VNTVELPLVELEAAQLLESDKPWHAQRLPVLEERARTRLNSLSRRLDESEWLDGNFSAGDLMMIGVLFRTKELNLLDCFSNLRDYVCRGENRPAIRRAFAAQCAVFEANQNF
jgi:glutathione S-transferase